MFSWSEPKNAANKRKHRISFEAAQFVFEDPLHSSWIDRIEGGEIRWQTIGMVAGVSLIVVIHTWDISPDATECIRIISARRATREERKKYEQGP